MKPPFILAGFAVCMAFAVFFFPWITDILFIGISVYAISILISRLFSSREYEYLSLSYALIAGLEPFLQYIHWHIPKIVLFILIIGDLSFLYYRNRTFFSRNILLSLFFSIILTLHLFISYSLYEALKIFFNSYFWYIIALLFIARHNLKHFSEQLFAASIMIVLIIGIPFIPRISHTYYAILVAVECILLITILFKKQKLFSKYLDLLLFIILIVYLIISDSKSELIPVIISLIFILIRWILMNWVELKLYQKILFNIGLIGFIMLFATAFFYMPYSLLTQFQSLLEFKYSIGLISLYHNASIFGIAYYILFLSNVSFLTMVFLTGFLIFNPLSSVIFILISLDHIKVTKRRSFELEDERW